MPDPIPSGTELGVTGVFAEFETMFFHIAIDLAPPDAEERTHDGNVRFSDAMPGHRAHGGEACGTCPAEQIEQRRFHKVISMVSQENCVAALSACDRDEESEASNTGRRLN